MADAFSSSSGNLFDQFDLSDHPGLTSASDSTPAPASANADATSGASKLLDIFDLSDQPQPDKTSLPGSIAFHAALGAVPAAGGIMGTAAGAAAGAWAGIKTGALFGAAVPVAGETGWGEFLGGVAGGIGGAVLGGMAANKAQDIAIQQLPSSWRDPLEEYAQESEKEHPYGSMLGGLVPFIVTGNPFSAARKALPDNATLMQRIKDNPMTARLFGGAVQGGFELGQEALSGDPLDWRKAAIATGFGVVFHRQNPLGTKIENVGARPVRRLLGLPEPQPHAAAAETIPPATTVEEQPGAPPPTETGIPASGPTTPSPDVVDLAKVMADIEARRTAIAEAERRAYGEHPTIAQSADVRVMGAGIDEYVHQGSHRQDPRAEMIAQDQARTEAAVLGPPPPPPDVGVAARRMEPELFEQHEAAIARRDALQRQTDELPEGPEKQAADARLAAVDAQIADTAPQIAAAHRRAAEATGGEMVPPPAIAPVVYDPAQRDFIAGDAARQFEAAGRPREEAGALGQIVAANMAALAHAFEGKIGTAEEIYRREGAEIRGERGGAPAQALVDQTTARDTAERIVARETPAPTRKGPSPTPIDADLARETAERIAAASTQVASKTLRAKPPGQKKTSIVPPIDVEAAKAKADRLGVTKLIQQLAARGVTPDEIADTIGAKMTGPEIAVLMPKVEGESTPALAQTAEPVQSEPAAIRQEASAVSPEAARAKATKLGVTKLIDGFLANGASPTEVDDFLKQNMADKKMSATEIEAMAKPTAERVNWDRETIGNGQPLPDDMEVVNVPVAALDAAFRRDAPDFHVETPKTATVEHAQAGAPVSLAEVGAVDGKIGVQNGRNRLAVAKALGEETIPIAVERTNADAVREAIEPKTRAPEKSTQHREKVQAETLLAFLKRIGGIKDSGGELRVRDLVRGYPGLVNNKRGLSLDDARAAAAESGYLGGRPDVVANSTINDLLDALDSHPHYSVHDMPEVMRARDATAANLHARRIESAAQTIDEHLAAIGERPLDREWRILAAEIYREQEIPNADAAIESAAIQLYERDAEQAHLHREASELPRASHEFEAIHEGAGEQGEEGPYFGERPGAEGHAGAARGEVREAGGLFPEEPATDSGPEGTRQALIPGVRPVTDIDRIEAAIAKPLRGGNAPFEHGGLFGDAHRQLPLLQGHPENALGRYTPADVRRAPRGLLEIFRNANATTAIHELGHDFFDRLSRYAAHPDAPMRLRADWAIMKQFARVRDDIPLSAQRRAHERVANAFMRYLSEGVAPTRGLADAFARFKSWMASLYATVKGLRVPINDDIRGVFDRLLSAPEGHTVIAPESERGRTLADIHEADAAETPVTGAEPAARRVDAEREQHAADVPESIVDEVAKAHEATAQQDAERAAAAGTEPAAGAGEGAGGRGPLGEDSGRSEPVAGGGGVGIQPGAEREGQRNFVGESPRGAKAAAGRSDVAEPAKSPRPDPLPATVFGPDDTGIVDKAGNIRLDKFDADTDVKQVIRDAAERNDGFIGDRRGQISPGQVADLAQALGMDLDTLNARKIGQAFNAEQIHAARKLLLQSAEDVHEKMRVAAKGSDEDVLAYAEAKDRHQMIQAQVAGITAEAGRALAAFKMRVGEGAGGEAKAMAVNEFIKKATGKTLYQLREEATLGSAMDTPEKISKMMHDAAKRHFSDMVLEYVVNGYISGLPTHITYSIGNSILSALKAGPETLAAAAIGRARQATGREGEAVLAGESGAQLFGGVARGFAPALHAGLESLRAGVTAKLPDEAKQKSRFITVDTQRDRSLPFQPGAELAPAPNVNLNASYRDAAASAFAILRGSRDALIATAALLKAGGIEGEPLFGARYSPLGSIPDFTIKGVNVAPLGSAIRLPSRGVAAIHAFFRTMNFSMEKSALAYRQAAGEGLTGGKLAERVGELWQNPDDAIMNAAAAHEATQSTLMGQGGEFTQALARLTNTRVFGIKFLKFVDPFVRISSNIIEQSLIARTPIGILAPEIRADLLGQNGNIAQDKAMARMLVGTALGITFGGLAASGYASGSGPSDPKQAAMWRMLGNQPHSVRIGDMWYDVHRLGVMGMLMGVAADMYDVAHQASEGNLMLAGATLQHALTQNVLDESFVRGPADLIKAMEDPGRYGEGYLRQWATSFVPYSVGMAQMARATDPYARQARTVMDAIRAKIPGQSEALFARRDIWGQPIPNLEALGAKGVTAIYETRMSRDPVNIAMYNLGIYPAPVERKIRNVQLTDQQYDDFARIAGITSKTNLDRLVNSPQFRTWPDDVRHDLMKKMIDDSREAARGMVMAKYPQIPAQATKAKSDKIRGIKP